MDPSLPVPPPTPLALPPAERIRDVAETVLADPDYRIDAPEIDFVPLLQRVLEFLESIFRPIAKGLARVPGLSPFWAWVIMILLLVVLVALIVHISYTILMAVRGPKRGALAAEEESALERPETWEAKAREAADGGHSTEAARCMLRAGLLRLTQWRDRPFRRGATNREYLRQFRDTGAFEPLGRMVEIVDAGWYGGLSCSMYEFERCRDAHATIRQWVKEAVDANAA